MKKTDDLISDEQINIAFGYANFGKNITKREVVNNTLLKCASGYSSGHTASCIVRELGLVKKKCWELTVKGKEYLFVAYSNGNSF